MQKVSDNLAVIVILVMTGLAITLSGFIYMLIKNQFKLHRQKHELYQAEISHHDQLLRAVIESQEAERIRIGRDLHDDVCTSLSSLRLQMEMWMRTLQDDAGMQAGIITSKRIIDKIIGDARTISHNLSPEILTVNTPSEALDELCSSVFSLKELTIRLFNEVPATLDSFDLMSSLAVYRILEELIHNTVKHAQASRITISINRHDGLMSIEYQDDGIGCALPLYKGRGMQNVESRLRMIGGSYTLLQSKENGYHLRIEIPILLGIQKRA